MAQKQVKCPACPRRFSRRSDLRSHLTQALSGWDVRWNPSEPHTRWARSNGIEVSIEVTGGEGRRKFDKLDDALDKYLSGQ